MSILRGEIYFVELAPTRGREINDKRRPVVVLSSNEMNRRPLVVVVVPGTTWRPARPVHSNEVKVDPSTENGLTASTVFQCLQIRGIDHSRFDGDPTGELAPQDLTTIEQTVRRCLSLF